MINSALLKPPSTGDGIPLLQTARRICPIVTILDVTIFDVTIFEGIS
ncbi:hypothetical protein ACPOL_5745 [Acidisarcina polymorpha]|uniref:Uncharacterized protein n=1 Tax=Acidisarcina polymorpha TaxID=2211140 RepID=A0A2Z5G7D9_9BACT|nr:hypothetical protein ACPOL_5745 [Acidisarcina polymorpha]